MGDKMINTKSLLILLSIFSIVILSPDFSEAAVNVEGDDFANVEVGSIQKVLANIKNPSGVAVVLSGISFAPDSCSDFSRCGNYLFTKLRWGMLSYFRNIH
jgi:hypothetical protein